MNTLTTERRIAVIAALVEGNSIRATVRMTGVAKDTVLKLLVSIGRACEEYQMRVLRNLPCKRVQCDEIWSFCYAKAKNVPTEKRGQFGYGDVWVWTALCADTKLVPSWMVGGRDATAAYAFMHDLSGRLRNRIQLTTDGHRVYLTAVESAFGADIDYAMLVKQCLGFGFPEIAAVWQPIHTERQNLTMRMQMRRFTRLTNAFSKKVANHAAAVALHYMHYNFCRVHQTLRVTPAMEAGVADHVWSLAEVVALLDSEPKRAAA